MIEQARAAGLSTNQALINHLAWGLPMPPSKSVYVAPNAVAELHVSLTGAWDILEWLPKRAKWKEWHPESKTFLGWYLPMGEPRPIPEGAIIHRSVIERMTKLPSYKPINLPASYTIEEGPPPPAGAIVAQDAGKVGAPA